jgi:DNA modification methylase
MSEEQLLVVKRSIRQLKPNRQNARKHPRHQIRQIADSISTFGFTNAILVDSDNQIVAGAGRFEAAKELGMTEVPTVRIDWLSKEQLRAYILADNKLAENAGWDQEILAIELQALVELDCPDFDVTITGFEMAEIDSILESTKGDDSDDGVPEPDLKCPSITEPGDTWQLGDHRIHCGNSLHDGPFRAILRNRRAAATFTDPPYNVKIDGHATGNGSIHHREFSMASGEMSEAEFLSFLNNTLRLIANNSTNGAISYVCMDWRHAGDLIAAGRQNFDELLNICVWVKNSGGMGSFYRSQHELVFVFRKGKGQHRNNIQLGKFGRNRTNVWQYPGVQTMSKQGDEGNLLAFHPTVKPIAMVADSVLDCTVRGDILLDPFLGSGTTLMAAQRVGRICCGIEIDPAYVDVAIRRWQNYTGEAAIHAGSGKRFDEIAVEKEVVHG